MNKFEFLGRLTKDIEIVTAKNGKNFVKFTVAVDRKSDKEKTDFIDCVAFGKLAETLLKYVEKGNRILIEGELNINFYDDKDGKKQKSVSVLVNDFYFVDFKKELTKKENNF